MLRKRVKHKKIKRHKHYGKSHTIHVLALFQTGTSEVYFFVGHDMFSFNDVRYFVVKKNQRLSARVVNQVYHLKGFITSIIQGNEVSITLHIPHKQTYSSVKNEFFCTFSKKKNRMEELSFTRTHLNF